VKTKSWNLSDSINIRNIVMFFMTAQDFLLNQKKLTFDWNYMFHMYQTAAFTLIWRNMYKRKLWHVIIYFSYEITHFFSSFTSFTIISCGNGKRYSFISESSPFLHNYKLESGRLISLRCTLTLFLSN